MKNIIVLILFLTMLFQAKASDPLTTKEAIGNFHEVFNERSYYFKARNSKIDSLKRLISDAQGIEEKAMAYEKTGNEYAGVSVDSALSYYSRGEKLSADNKLKNNRIRFILRRLSLQPFGGIVKETLDELDTIDPDSLPAALRPFYHSQKASIYYNISRFYPEGAYCEHYKALAAEANDSLLKYLLPESVEYRLVEAQIDMLNGDKTIAFANFTQLLPLLDGQYDIKAKITALMSEYYEGNPDKDDERIYYLTISATNDIMAGNREVSSLQRLGKEAYLQGHTVTAAKILAAAMDDASHSGSRLNIIESAEMFPSLINIISDSESTYKTILIAVSCALIMAIIAIVVLFIYLRLRKKAVCESITKESQIKSTKQVYTAKLLDLCSFYMDKIEDFNTYVGRKLKAGQVQDLNSAIESKNSLKKYADEFYAKFDETLLELYPSFIEDLNSLLLPEKQLHLSESCRLTPELRIAMFMQLGITDSNMLSKFLGLSVNTVYTYRNRLKNRASDRENFEENLMKLH